MYIIISTRVLQTAFWTRILPQAQKNQLESAIHTLIVQTKCAQS